MKFMKPDIADAMLLGRLFTELLDRGVVAVATANLPPGELYQDGLNRTLFLPFIALIEGRMEVVRLDARTDFRLEKLASAPVWHVGAVGTALSFCDASEVLMLKGIEKLTRSPLIAVENHRYHSATVASLRSPGSNPPPVQWRSFGPGGRSGRRR